MNINSNGKSRNNILALVFYLVVSIVVLITWQCRGNDIVLDWTQYGFAPSDNITINPGDNVIIYNEGFGSDLQLTGAPPETFYFDVPNGNGTNYVYNNVGTFSFSDQLDHVVTVNVYPVVVIPNFGSRYVFSGHETNITLNPGLYDITAYGAQGGDTQGGFGAEMEGEFSFTNVTILTLLVGGAGQGASTYQGAGGGGGSFVVDGTTLLVIAGGGGGGADPYTLFSFDGDPGLTGESGGNGATGDGGGFGSGGSGGSGGGGAANVGGNGGGGAGGGGYSGTGGNSGGSYFGGYGGKSYLNGGAGGEGYGTDYPIVYYGQGGYGCGGAGNGGGGGGGGYSGGGGGGALVGGGGGGSYIDSSAIANVTEVSGVVSPDDSPNGEIIINAAQLPLYISRLGNTVSVYWPAIPGWSLQQNTNLANSSSWTASSGMNTVNDTSYLNITASTGSLFFRLQEQ